MTDLENMLETTLQLRMLLRVLVYNMCGMPVLLGDKDKRVKMVALVVFKRLSWLQVVSLMIRNKIGTASC